VNLWDEMVPDRTLVLLSGRDILSAGEHIKGWLSKHTQAVVSAGREWVLSTSYLSISVVDVANSTCPA
jgi:hypothetical protein